MESAVDGYFEKLGDSHFRQGIETIENRWGKCIEVKRNTLRKKEDIISPIIFMFSLLMALPSYVSASSLACYGHQ